MHGSVKGQVNFLWQRSGLNHIGQSKHAAKEVAREAGARTWHEIGKNIGVFSYSTQDAYQDVWRQSFAYARENYGIRDLEKIEVSHIKGFLQSKLDAGCANATLRQYCSAHEKLEQALNHYNQEKGTGRTYDFSKELREIRRIANQSAPRFEGTRAYKNPERVIENIKDDRYRTIAAVQREGGARVHEVRFGREDLKGIRNGKGVLSIRKGKGGKPREIRVEMKTYQEIKKEVAKLHHGQKWGIKNESDKNAYRADIKAACERAGEQYKNPQGKTKGSHGFRYNYAQDRHQEVQQEGKSYLESLSQVSDEMGHVRGDITEHYLK